MAKSIKEALVRAGFESKEQKQVVERKLKKMPLSKEMEGHKMKAQCENCGNFAPDVERYNHTNRLVTGQWLCMRCADDNNIDDRCRMSAQSSYSCQGVFIRQYGRTMKL